MTYPLEQGESVLFSGNFGWELTIIDDSGDVDLRK